MNPRVVVATANSDHSLTLVFANGETRRFDVRPYLVYPVYVPLREMAYFLRAKAAHGTVAWPGEEDFCPDTLYVESQPVAREATG